MERRKLAYRFACCLIAVAAQAQVYKDIIVLPNGSVTWRNSADTAGFTLTIPGGLASDVSYSWNPASGSVGDCIKITSAGNLGFGACAAGSSGWSITSGRLHPTDTTVGLEVIPNPATGQYLGALDKPWSGVTATQFSTPNAGATAARTSLSAASLIMNNFAGSETFRITSQTGNVDIATGSITTGGGGYYSNGTASTDTDVVGVQKAGSLSSSNWKWALSHRSDGRQLWIYGYDGTNFSIPLKLNPTGNSVCINCSGDATAGYTLDVNGQILTTGLKANGNSGYVNAAQIEIRNSLALSSGLHFGFNAWIDSILGVGGQRHVTLQDEQSNPLMRWASYVAPGLATPTITTWGHFLPGTNNAHDIGSVSKYWRELRVGNSYMSTLRPLDGGYTDIGVFASLFPSANNTWDLGVLSGRWKKIYAVDLDLSGTCTGCPAGNWTTTSGRLHPSSSTAAMEIVGNPSSGGQFLGALDAPWAGVTATQFSIPNSTATAARVSLSAASFVMNSFAGTETARLSSSSGNLSLAGNINLSIMAGSGTVHACFDASGNFVRGTVSGC